MSNAAILAKFASPDHPGPDLARRAPAAPSALPPRRDLAADRNAAPSPQRVRRAIAKLSFSPRDDVRILTALAAYPDSRHSAVLAAWLRAGWRFATGRAVAAPICVAGLPGRPLPQRLVVRRVFVDAAAEPGLADFLGTLPRHERGREIRHFIEVALRRAMAPGAHQAASTLK